MYPQVHTHSGCTSTCMPCAHTSLPPSPYNIIPILIYSQTAFTQLGTQACTLDIAKFHCICPILPSHKPWLILQGHPGTFFVDHDHPFGAAGASSNAGMITNTALNIWEGKGVLLMLKYKDNLNVFHYPPANGHFIDGDFYYNYDCTEVLKRIKQLGILWPKEKGSTSFTSTMTFISFLWNIPAQQVSLPTIK